MGIFIGGGITLEPGISLVTPPPPIPGSLYFSDGVTDGLTLPSILNLTSITTFTIEAWVYPTALNTSTCIIGDISGGTTDWELSILNGNLQFYWDDGITGYTSTGNSTINEDEWTHVALSVSSTVINLFVNGSIQTITGQNNFIVTGSTTNQIVIGNKSFDASDAFLGYITNLRINNSNSLYNAPFVPQIPLINTVGTTLLLLVESNDPFADSSVSGATVTDLGSVSYNSQYP